MSHLTNAQLLTLKAAIAAETDPTFVGYRSANDKPSMAAWFSADSSPAFIVWKTNVPVGTVGKAFVATALAAITAGNNDKLASFALWNPTGVDPSRADQRAFFDDIFSVAAGASTRAALLALWKRTARRIEKLFAVGTGSDAVPALLVFEGTINSGDIGEALEAV